MKKLISKIGRFVAPPRWQQIQALFGLTTGRCGTTTLTRLMKQSPEIVATHEPPPHVRDPLRTRPFYKENEDDSEFRRTVQQLRAWKLWRIQQQGKKYVELNGMKFYASTIAEMMPQSRFVFIHRHPADFVRSGMRRGWYDRHPADENRLRPRKDDPIVGPWQDWQAFEKICWLWAATNRYFLDFLSTIPGERYRSISFDTVMNVETEAYRELFELLNVTPPDTTAAMQVLTVRHNSQTTDEFPKYDRWSGAQRSRLMEIAGGTMRQLGYK